MLLSYGGLGLELVIACNTRKAYSLEALQLVGIRGEDRNYILTCEVRNLVCVLLATWWATLRSSDWRPSSPQTKGLGQGKRSCFIRHPDPDIK